MATAGEIVSGAYRKLGAKPADSAITGDEMTDGIETLNDMMAELENAGLLFGYEKVLSPSKVIRVPVGTENYIKCNLAGYIAPELSIQITPTLAAQIAESRKSALKILSRSIKVRYPDTLPVGSGNRCDGSFAYDDIFYHGNKKQNF